MRLTLSSLRYSGFGLAATLAVAGCDGGERERWQEQGPVPAPAWVPEPTPSNVGLRLMEELELGASVPEAAKLVGVAIAPNGDRYVLDSGSGLYRLGASGAELVLDSTKLAERYGLSPDLELTDVVAYGPDRFLITAENDGFLLDLWAGTMESYFCYFPPLRTGDEVGQEPGVPVSISQLLTANGVPVEQRTESVTVNAATGEIFAQPQTLMLDSSVEVSGAPPVESSSIAGSELFVFASAGGQPSDVRAVDTTFLAGGMVAWNNRLLLGFRAGLFEMTLDGLYPMGDLVSRPVSNAVVVTGMALDLDGSLLVLDGPSRRLFRFQLDMPQSASSTLGLR